MAEEKTLYAEELPETMRASIVTEYGKPSEIVSVGELPVPQIGPNQVLVRVHAASINPADGKSCKGGMRLLKEWTFPRSLGYNLSGIVVGLGANLVAQNENAPFKLGDAVLGQTDLMSEGTICEYAVAPANRLFLKPDTLDWIQAAGIPCVACTSYQALAVHGKVSEGKASSEKKLLILGGTTSTGMAAIQMAKKLFKVQLVATTSGNEEMCKRLGADVVVNYRESNWWEELSSEKFDIIYDCVGGYESWAHAQSMMVSGGRYVSVVGDSIELNLTYGSVASNIGSTINRGFWSMFGYPSWSVFFQDATANYSDFVPQYADGTLEIVLDPRTPYSFDEESVKKAYSDSESGRAKGKLVIEIRQE